ncbi:MAG: hypothetical protein ACW986_08950 [Promethearchaeota archaeon]|jgi:tetratricopeptide (TPR) repeat protein
MSRSEEIVFPPGNILNPIVGKTDYEFVILWMLNNNDICEWSDFTSEISESTLSGHLKKLIFKGFIDKPEKGKYIITSSGRERYNELTYDKKSGKRRKNYPPKTILKRRNYDHWILWMVYNNHSCKWSDFKQEPLSINQSSLSTNLNSLMENGFVERDNKEYVVSPSGKIEYFNIIKLYDLDRQSILEQESKRIGEITEKASALFTQFKISDDELKFRYLDHFLKLPYSKVESMLRNEDDFNKILLYLSINHPDQYPNYISPEEFSLQYNIDNTTLNYYIREIIENQFFQIKFFKLNDAESGTYYFQMGEPIEKVLNAIVEKHITKFTYLNNFQENPELDLGLLIDKILENVCGSIFDERLKIPLRRLLPDYIKYLAYKIETEKKLVDSEAKLEGFVWQNIFEEFQTFEPSIFPIGTGQEDEVYYSMEKQVFDVMDIAFLTKLDFLKTIEVQETYNLRNIELFEKIGNAIYKYKTIKARELLDGNNENIDTLTQLILEDLLVTAEYNFEDSLTLTDSIITQFPNEFIGYLLQSLTYFMMDDYENSLKVVDRGLEAAPNVLLHGQKTQIKIKTHKGEELLEFIEELLQQYPNNVTLLRLKYLSYVTHWQCCVREFNVPLEVIDTLIAGDPDNQELLILKSLYFCMVNKYREAKRFLIKEVELNILKKDPRIHTSLYFILTFTYIARGKFEKSLDIANQMIELYPDHPISHLTKALVLGYNLIYKFRFQEPDIDNFLDLIKKSMELDLHKYNITRYLQFQGYVLQGTGRSDEAIQSIDTAIEILPNQNLLYGLKTYFLISSNRDSEALELIDEYIENYPQLVNSLYKQKTFLYCKLKEFEKGLKTVNIALEKYPQDIALVNNKTILLGYLERKEETIETANHLISLNPSNGNSYDTYGEVLMTFGEYKNALQKLEKALSLEPTGWFAYETCIKMSKCHKELGNLEKALEYAEKGKLLTDKMLPAEREMSQPKIEEIIAEIRELMGRPRKNGELA